MVTVGPSLWNEISPEDAFGIEYSYLGVWQTEMVKPIHLPSVVVFLVRSTDIEKEPVALVFNSKNEWSDIERESTGLTRAIGLAIEEYYSNRYFLAATQVLN